MKKVICVLCIVVVIVAASCIRYSSSVDTEMPSPETRKVIVATTPAPTPTPTVSPPPTPTPAPTPSPEPIAPTPPAYDEPDVVSDDGSQFVYVPGFGYIESGGASVITPVEGMYENGNKIGLMG